MTFLTDLWHPSIYNSPDRKGELCISILHPPGDDEWGWEDASERWLPVHSVESILVSVISLLSSDSPCTDSPANVDAAKQVREDPAGYKKTVPAQPLSSNSTLDDISFKDILTRSLFSLYGSVNGSFYVDVLAVTQKQSNGLQKVALKCSSKHQQLLENAITSYEIYQGASLRAAKSRNDSPTFYVDISPRMTSMAVYKSYSMKQLAFARYRASFEITIQSGDALATFEKSHSGIRKQGVLRMSAPGYTDDDLAMIFMTIVVLVRVDRKEHRRSFDSSLL
ncbi:hypothetical protein E3Q09_01256 [Wallemia mellicola]|nr:hypothetical protein E3Q21_01623 [Wallemia mellicola]TIC36596.1 hypothetical protein E3Q09_01256 [Wallemia mellicola]TIC41458.1 hypothetical protein E3Q07_01607 [Wallemia mellicola]TIC55457.1 hypothetical protein E3Q04_01543 [Wallemia mellicola]